MTSPELIVFCAEIISMIDVFAGGLCLDAEALALEAIHQVGPGGMFLAHDHTLRHFREVWRPALFSRQRMTRSQKPEPGPEEERLKGGGASLSQRLRDRTIAIMDSHVPRSLPDRVRQEIEMILHG
jgi:trimethylamine--corrinoid protein Co-methyltransferase